MERVRTMTRRSVAPRVVLALLIFSPMLRSQSAPPKSGAAKEQEAAPADLPPLDGWGRPITSPAKVQKPAPPPQHDLSGIWDPPPPGLGGIQVFGANEMPEDGKPQHQLPYTPLGLEALSRTKPNSGIRAVLPAESNDPVFPCDPQGMPREDLYELRTLQIYQSPQNVAILYQFARSGGSSGRTGGNSQRIQTRGGMGIQSESGWMIIRWSSRRSGRMTEPGSIELAVRIAEICALRSCSTAPIMIIWS
jgi:hypothetical protein